MPSIHFPSSAIHFCNLAILVGFEPIRRMKGGRRMRLLIQWARRRGAGGTGGGEGGRRGRERKAARGKRQDKSIMND